MAETVSRRKLVGPCSTSIVKIIESGCQGFGDSMKSSSVTARRDWRHGDSTRTVSDESFGLNSNARHMIDVP